MPEARERYRAEYDGICSRLLEISRERGELPVDLLELDGDKAVTVCAISVLSHEILSGRAGAEQYRSWVELWRRLIVFERLEQTAIEGVFDR